MTWKSLFMRGKVGFNIYILKLKWKEMVENFLSYGNLKKLCTRVFLRKSWFNVIINAECK